MILLTKSTGSPQKATEISGQKSLQYFFCHFGHNGDTKKIFRNWLTLAYNLLTTELQKVLYLLPFWSQLHYLADMNLFSHCF